MIIHDLRNPLTGTLGYLDLIEGRVLRNDEQILRYAVRMEDGKMTTCSELVNIAKLAAERTEHYH